MGLFVRGERVHQAIDRGRGAVSMQRTHHKNAHLRGGHRDAHGLEVPKLAHQNDVRILAQCRRQRARERGCVHADLALADQAVLAQMHEFDRIFDGENMAFFAAVDVVDHRRERGGLARTGFTRDQDQTTVDLAQIHHGFRQFELRRRTGLRRNRAEHRAHAVQLAHHIDAEAGNARHGVREIRAVLGLETFDRQLRHDFIQRLFDHLRREGRRVQGLQLAVLADARRIARYEVQVRATPAHDLFQQLIEKGAGKSLQKLLK